MSFDYADLDLGPPLRDSLMDSVGVLEELGQWKGEPAIFTRRPLPQDAPDQVIIIEDPMALTDADALNSDRPIVHLDISFHGRKGAPGTSEDDTRVVVRRAYRARDHFHRQKFSVQPQGFSVIDVRAEGPVVGPTDNDKAISRIVTLTIRLRRARP